LGIVAYACAAFGNKWQLYLRYRMLFYLPEETGKHAPTFAQNLFERNTSTTQ